MIGSAYGNLITMDLSSNVTSMYQFSPTVRPLFGLVYASDDSYYGVSVPTSDPTGVGSVYQVTPGGSYSTLYTFPSGTFLSNTVALLQAGDGNLYGTTPNGGTNGTGTVYKVTLGGKYTLLYSFPAGGNYTPNALIEGSDGNLYGVTLGASVSSQLFRLTKSGQYTLLYTMTARDGQCYCSLTLGSDGIIYGTAQGGGTALAGTVFALNAGLPEPAPRPRQFTPQEGPIGTNVMIWGQNMPSASVQFNGVPATAVSNSGSNYVWATVPTGTITGPITVTTPGGMFKTKASFTVQ